MTRIRTRFEKIFILINRAALITSLYIFLIKF